jgi:ribosome-binding factor A
MASRRQRKVGDLIHEELSDLVARKMRDPRVQGVTITEVRVSPDLRYADVYVSKLGGEEEAREAVAGLSAASGYLKRELASRVVLRFLPDLRFHLDRSWQQGSRIDALLEQIAAERRERQPEESEEE